MLANNPSVLTGGGVATNLVNGTGLFANGTVAAPSISFANDTSKGFYFGGSNSTIYATGGARSLNFGPNGALYGAESDSQFLSMPSTGAIALTASGTNRNITLTPSGTGGILGQRGGASSGYDLALDNSGGNGTYIELQTSATRKAILGVSSSTNGLITGSATGDLCLRTESGSVLWTVAGATPIKMKLAATTGNLLLGGLTTDGTGVLQLATHTTSAGGIGFGTDTFLYRSAASTITAPFFRTLYDLIIGVGAQLSVDNIATAAGVSLVIKTGGSNTTALTLDSSQNATFAGIVIHKSYTVATLPAAAAGNTYGTTFVSDATQLAGVGIGTAPTGGGSVKRAVYSTGGGWLLL